MELLSVIAIASSEHTRTALESQLQRLDFLNVVGVSMELSDAVLWAQQQHIDAIVIELTNRELDGGMFIQAINMNIESPSAIIALHRQLDTTVMVEAIRQGAKEFIQYPEELEKLESALRKQSALINRSMKSSQSANKNTTGKLISFFSAKGGTGSSTIAFNTAYELYQKTHQPVAILDMDQIFNNTAVMLKGLKPSFSVGDIAGTAAGDLDEGILQRITVQHESGLHIVVGCKNVLDENEMASPELMQKMFDYLVRQYRYVVVDLPSRILDPYHEFIVERADMAVLVASLDVPSLYRTRQYLNLIKQYYGEDKIKLVVNRHNLKAVYRVSTQSVEEEIRYPIWARIPNDWELNVEANSLGCFLGQVSSNAEIVKSLQTLSSLLISDKVTAASPEKNVASGGGLLGKLFQGINPGKSGGAGNAVSKT